MLRLFFRGKVLASIEFVRTQIPLVKGLTPNTPTEIKNKEMYIIRITEVIKKIKEYYEIIKADFIRTLSGTNAECTLPIDTYALENFVRCVWYDITEFFSKEENVINCRQQKPENADTAPLTEEDV